MSIEDRLYPFLKYYSTSPQILRSIIGSIYRIIPLSIRYGKMYSYYNKLVKESAYWTDSEKEKYTRDHLKLAIQNAYYNTNYYKQLFDNLKINIDKIDDPSVFNNIPFLDKDIIRTNKSSILNTSIPKNKLLYMTTGGTSGIPIELYYLKGEKRTKEYIFMTKQWERVGYHDGDKILVLRGSVVVDRNSNNNFFKYDPIKNRLYLSSYDLFENNFPKYVKKIHEFNPKYIHTYPSAVMVLAKYIVTNNIKIDGIQSVFCSSEQFYPGQREIIEKAFNCRVFSWYGHSESTTLAGECELNNDYHLFFEYGYTELIDKNGKVITESGVPGEIVGTSFGMTAFPIIRYRTGDFAMYAGYKCKCGRNYTLIKNVKGRWKQENIITKLNSSISLTALNMHSNIFDNLIQYQFHQKEIGKVNLKIIKSINFTYKDENLILKSFKEKFKDLVDLSLIYVNNIDRTKRGKHKFLIQEIKETY